MKKKRTKGRWLIEKGIPSIYASFAPSPQYPPGRLATLKMVGI